MAKGNICRIENCNKPAQITGALCSMHKGRWERHKSFDAPFKPFDKPNIIKICKIHGELTTKDIRRHNKNDVLKNTGIYCRICHNIRIAQWQKNNPDKTKLHKAKKNENRHGRHRLKLYGVTEEQYKQMVKEQDNKCAICKQPEKRKLHGKICSLSLDHDHKTGKVRQLLCHQHNLMIGYAGDAEEILQAGLDYIRRHKTTE